MKRGKGSNDRARGPRRDAKRGPQSGAKRGPQQGPKRGPQRDARGPQRDARGPQRDARGPQRGPGRPARGDFGPKRAAPGMSSGYPRPSNRPAPVIRPPAKEVKFPTPAPPRVGEWLLTTRAGAEQDLLDELTMGPFDGAPLPRLAGPALVAVSSLPKTDRPELAFARQGFPIAAIGKLDDRELALRLSDALGQALPQAQGRAARDRGPQPFSLDAWVPDDDRTNPQIGQAEALGARVLEVFSGRDRRWAPLHAADARAAWTDNGMSAQLCVADGHAYLGVLPARDLPSLAPGGRMRMHVPKHAPSRAAAKLLEAFVWLDRAPEAGEMCVDLGAAPGGWTWVLLERGARVLAIDPGKLDPLVARRHGLTHVRADAFSYEPEGFADWLVADMAWRPLEAAALYGKWARRGWARMMICNIKLPMRKKAEYLLRVKDILSSSGWGNLRARQLYHDRDEVTLGGVLGGAR